MFKVPGIFDKNLPLMRCGINAKALAYGGSERLLMTRRGSLSHEWPFRSVWVLFGGGGAKLSPERPIVRYGSGEGLPEQINTWRVI